MPIRWEYQILAFDEVIHDRIEQSLNDWGEEGWELVHVSSSLRTYYLKRQMITHDDNSSSRHPQK